jgi:hypothetical protein
MKTTDTHAFANQLLVCLLVTFGFGGSIGLGTVWMRHQNALLANSNRVLVARIADVERRIAEATTQVEGEQGSDVLRRRNTDWHLGLVPATETQVTCVTEDTVMRLARQNSRELFKDSFASVSVRIAMKN